MAPGESEVFIPGEFAPHRPNFHIGYHNSERNAPPTDIQYGNLLNQGFNFVTTPLTNDHFRERVFRLVQDHLAALKDSGDDGSSNFTTPGADPILPPLTPQDTSVFPSAAVNTYTGCISPWIDPCSPNRVISSISRQVLNLEINYANFCGIRSLILPGPTRDASKDGGIQGLAQYSRAVQEALTIGSRLTFLVHMPMYREPLVGLEPRTLSSVLGATPPQEAGKEIDLYTAWDSWNHIRSVCDYDMRLFVALRIPKVMPEMALQNRWFAEPLHYLTIGPEAFQFNKPGYPSLSKHHQNMIFTYMRLKNTPWLLLSDLGSDGLGAKSDGQGTSEQPDTKSHDQFPSLAEAGDKVVKRPVSTNDYLSYVRWLEMQQTPLPALESNTLTSFQDWLQSPLQPLADNLESATYEVFEGDPVKYNQYEAACIEALSEWKELGKPTSKEGVVVIAVAGSGRGPLVTRALTAAEFTGVPVEVWAVEKNPNAYVYLLRQNEAIWGGRVKVVKTDMRAWKGPIVSESPETGPVYGKVDILISELLGSFADNELSPECLDGIQHVMAKPHGISIPSSYTAHLSPIATPKLYADILSRYPTESTAFDTPWVVRLFAIDFVSQRVPGHEQIQQAWEFVHPIPESTLKGIEARRSGGVVGGGGGSMAGAAGANDHNSRFSHLTFVCRTRGVVHGLAGYFESTLYESQLESSKGQKVEISTHPERIDDKSKDMISWFPIFFPLKQPLYFPADSELEVSMWRQTDDTKVWYEWLVEAWMWAGESNRIKVGSSALCSSRKVACLM
ncbi:unnamed protein product [Clonostachys byssicola]|uniref:Protein arginine N-methyltransferase n=1 Tax=Clonostachys byssicola TaxID=160290 RepID=A0A9N9U8J7_9HYPO|nr:unnamed protein product [Clonostachys byssicola]